MALLEEQQAAAQALRELQEAAAAAAAARLRDLVAQEPLERSLAVEAAAAALVLGLEHLEQVEQAAMAA
jgi:hypothetical protein